MHDIRYIIYSNGAGILDKETGEKTEICFSKELKKSMFGILSRYDVCTFVHADGKAFIDRKFKGNHAEYRFNDAVSYMADNLAVDCDDLENHLSEKSVECICVFFKTDEETEACKKELELDDRIRITSPWSRNLEIFDKRAGKGVAIKILAEKLGMDASEVIGIGDSNNDAQALEAVGLGICVSNGSDELKKIADEIACSNDEHVAEYVLKKYFS